MRRRGFALLAVLWVLAALTMLASLALAVAHTGAQTTRNRLFLARAAWGREACVEILLARYAQDPGVRRLDTIDLGRGTWCRARLEDIGAKLSVNDAPAAALRGAFRAVLADTLRADSLSDVVLARRLGRPFADVAELRSEMGGDSLLIQQLEAVLTARGPGMVDVNVAPPAVLASVPGLGEEARAVMLDRRALGRPVPSADTLLTLLSPNAQSILLSAYRDFVQVATFSPTQLLGTIEGGVRGTPLRARVAITFVPTPGRLAVIRRETE